MHSKKLNLCFIALACCFTMGAFGSGCSDDDDNPANTSKAGTFYGPEMAMGNGTVRTWVKLDDNGNPGAIGVTISAEALNNLPPDAASLVLDLPTQAAATVFKHVFFNWNPGGHPPPGIYDAPHFDVHFYTTTNAEREQITITGEGAAKLANLPGADYIPADYRPDQNPVTEEFQGVPAMGLHWTDATSPEWNGSPFTETFIWGSYDGKFIFLEPMVTKEFLETEPNMTEDLKLPNAYDFSGYYPTKYSINTDTETGDYSISLDAMVMR